MTLPPYLKPSANGVTLAIKVQPRAAKTEIAGPEGNELKIRVTAPPVDSAANDALLRFLADTLDCPRSALQILRGQTSRHKVIAIAGFTAEQIVTRLAADA